MRMKFIIKYIDVSLCDNTSGEHTEWGDFY